MYNNLVLDTSWTTSSSVFISYAHESDAHKESVRALAERLRLEGVTCTIDQDVEAPPEGWPQWMNKQVAGARFVLVLSSKLYRRRFEGNEEPGVGKGVKWEGAIITQELYDLEGRNERFIPVILSESDVGFIPHILAGQTRYNVNTAAGYEKLLNRVRSNTSVAARRTRDVHVSGDSGLFDWLHASAAPRTVSDLKVESARFLLQVCRDGLPVEVLADAVDVERDALHAIFTTNRGGVREGHDGNWLLDALSALPEPDDAANLKGRALDALLAYLKRHRGDAQAEAQVWNAVQLAETCWNSRPKSVAPLFVIVDKLIKRKGDKRLVLRAAELSIAGARRAPLRTDAEAQAEARSLVCGRAWVYQRIGRLKEAGIAIEEAARLARDIGSPEILAFCKKCLARVRRLEAEETSEDGHRRALLKESDDLLRHAIDCFEGLPSFGPDHPEVGDCFSLLARTQFEAGDIAAAQSSCQRAVKLLTDESTKEWADFQILVGDIAANTDKRAALAYYDAVIDREDRDDATYSELRARAHFRRGIARKKLGEIAKAVADFKLARSIWKGLHDPLANKAEWAELWATDTVEPRMMKALERERFAVRVKAVQIHQKKLDSRRGTFVARRSDLPTAYLEQLKNEAREAVAVEEAEWCGSLL